MKAVADFNDVGTTDATPSVFLGHLHGGRTETGLVIK